MCAAGEVGIRVAGLTEPEAAIDDRVDLPRLDRADQPLEHRDRADVDAGDPQRLVEHAVGVDLAAQPGQHAEQAHRAAVVQRRHRLIERTGPADLDDRSEEHTSELQSPYVISYAAF